MTRDIRVIHGHAYDFTALAERLREGYAADALDALLAVVPLSECCAASPHQPCEDRCGDCHDNAVFVRTCPVCEAEVYPGDEAAHVTLACPTLHDEVTIR